MTLRSVQAIVIVLTFQLAPMATAAEFFGIGDVVGGPGLSHGRRSTLWALSGDGSTIVGTIFENSTRSFFRWQRNTGAVELGIEGSGSGSVGVVEDGSAILIALDLDDTRQRIIEWTENDLQDLAFVDRRYGFSQDTDNYIVGSKGSSPQEWFLWSKGNGLEVTNGNGWGHDVSATGKVVGILNRQAFVWTKQTGQFPLTTEPYAFTEARGISTDGTVIAGHLRRQSEPTGSSTLFRWTQEEGLQPLGAGTFSALSNDGSTIFGNIEKQAFRWTQETGFDIISLPSGNEDVLNISWRDVTSDGAMAAVVVTFPSGDVQPFVWRAGRGITTVEDMLANEFGLADRIAGWQFTSDQLLLSEDGRTLSGSGLNPDGFRDVWVADLHSEPGDFNSDGTIDAADYVVWRNGLGTTHTLADYDTWRANFGVGAAISTIADGGAIPEPDSALLHAIASVSVLVVAHFRRVGAGRTVSNLQRLTTGNRALFPYSN
jgi:uncharacterized membrane protein